MTYARSRLWLGISCVGTVVIFSIFALLLDYPTLLLATEAGSLSAFVSDIAIFSGLIFILISPFDLLGGYAFPKEYGRYSPKNLYAFFLGYLRGATMQVGFFILGAVVLSRTYSIGGYLGLTVITALLSLALLSLQERLSYLVSGIRTTSSKLLSEKYGYPVVVAKANDRSFTGGATGSLWNPKILIPKYWIDTLTQDELSVMIARRACSINSLSRTGGVVLASLFLTAGVLLSFYLTVSLSGLDPVSKVPGMLARCFGMHCGVFWAY